MGTTETNKKSVKLVANSDTKYELRIKNQVEQQVKVIQHDIVMKGCKFSNSQEGNKSFSFTL